MRNENQLVYATLQEVFNETMANYRVTKLNKSEENRWTHSVLLGNYAADLMKRGFDELALKFMIHSIYCLDDGQIKNLSTYAQVHHRPDIQQMVEELLAQKAAFTVEQYMKAVNKFEERDLTLDQLEERLVKSLTGYAIGNKRVESKSLIALGDKLLEYSAMLERRNYDPKVWGNDQKVTPMGVRRLGYTLLLGSVTVQNTGGFDVAKRGLHMYQDSEVAGLLERVEKQVAMEMNDDMNEENPTPTYDLNRFLEAQELDYENALAEIHDGHKESHWIWYIFPQPKGLGRSYNSEYYGLDGVDEARAYLEHPELGERLREISRALLNHRGKSIYSIMGSHIDVLKLKTCMELFDSISPNDIFDQVLTAFF